MLRSELSRLQQLCEIEDFEAASKSNQLAVLNGNDKGDVMIQVKLIYLFISCVSLYCMSRSLSSLHLNFFGLDTNIHQHILTILWNMC